MSPRIGRTFHRGWVRVIYVALLAVWSIGSVPQTGAAVLGIKDIPVLGLQVDVDTRPDIDGLQTTMTAVKDIPSGVMAFVGIPGGGVSPALPPGSLIKAQLSGPGFGDQTVAIAGAPNQILLLPRLGAAGDYQLFDVRLEDGSGRVILRRDPARPPISIHVIDQILVTQVTSRPLTLEEVQQKGIVIDASSFTIMNFTVGLTLGSEQIVIDLPVAIPATTQAAIQFDPPQFTQLPSVQEQFSKLNIPNFSLTGFSLLPPPELEEKGIAVPPIQGVIVIPGNIAFLNQFFSVILQATNVAPVGSGLEVLNAHAGIVLPAGGDTILGTGDDPLRIARTNTGGVAEVLPLVDANGLDVIRPESTNQGEFLVEGLREGTHPVGFNITGDLFVPALGQTVTLSGKAAGVVQVKNPTFSMVLAHPDVVREGEEYPLFATVTNTSSSPANLFRLEIKGRSLSGTRLADGETGARSLDLLAPGDSQTFEFRLIARTTGKVTGTVFLADEGINGSFILTTGVGDTGIPLSPDTLVLPQTVDYLPDQPDIVFSAVRMLGQAYSVATAPVGALPPNIARVTRAFVFDRAVRVAQAGLHIRFGETPLQAAEEILLDWFGNDAGRLDLLYPGDTSAQAQAMRDQKAFDGLRRAADAGHDLSDIFGEQIGQSLTSQTLSDLQGGWAETMASRPPHLSYGVSSDGPPVLLRLTDDEGRVLGRLDASAPVVRDLPFADRLPLSPSTELLLSASPQDARYTFEFALTGASTLSLSLVVPEVGSGAGMDRVIWPPVALPQGAYGRMSWTRAGPNTMQFEIDTNGDGVADQRLDPTSILSVVDRLPSVIGVHQWGKGGRPGLSPDFASGDPIGRMVGVLFSEEVTRASAERLLNYGVAGHPLVTAALQPDSRLVFFILDRPIGPFVARTLSVGDVTDQRAHSMSLVDVPVLPDPDRGVGGRFTGQVVGADGRPIPFASVKYIQPLSFADRQQGCLAGLNVRDFVIATYPADAEGRFEIEYVLQSDFPTPDCPTNPDIWLNEANPRGSVNFKLEALDPQTGEIGKASSRIQYDGQRIGFNVVIRGFGGIEGNVYDDAGHPVVGGDPGDPRSLQVIAQNISTGEITRSWVDASGHYAFPRTFTSVDGTRTEAPRVAVGNIILRIIRATDGFTAVDTINIPAAGLTVTRDLIMYPSIRFGTITGRVMESDGVTGAANVLIQVGTTAGAVGSMMSDETGFFRFESVPVGDIELRGIRQATFEQAAAKSFLSPGAAQDLVLVLPGHGGTVRGIVRDAFGHIIVGATVAGGPTLTQTDANGFFEISGLPLGSFTIFGQANGSPALGTVTIDSLGPSDVQEVVITLEPVGSIGGSVFEADGVRTITGQKVQLWVGNNGILGEAYTDGQGRYAFPQVPLGDYTVRAVRADYGDGGQALTSVRYAGDARDADITFRGLGRITGRVVQGSGTPALADVVITRKVWRVITDDSGLPNYYLDYARQLGQGIDQLAGTVDRVFAENNLNQPAAEFFFLIDEPVLLKSDLAGPNGEVTGRFQFTGPVTGGPFTVTAFGPFLAPAEVSGAIPVTTDPAQRIVDVGDIVLDSAVGSVQGTVYLPDGTTPVGANVRVKLRSLGDSGNLSVGGVTIGQPVLPEIDVVTDAGGRFEFPLVLRGNVVLHADTGVPDPAIVAHTAAEMNTTQFEDAAGIRLLNVRLFGQATGVVPQGERLTLDLRLKDVGGVALSVVENDGVTPVPFAEVTLNTASDLDAGVEADFVRNVADAGGLIQYFPVIEGNFSVSATKPGAPARGSASGGMPINPLNGHTESVTVTLGAVTTASGQVIPAQFFGAVSGTIFNADGTRLARPAQVTVRASGVEILTTSDAMGHFLVESVPGGFFSVEAFEPFTARRGGASGRIVAEGHVVDLPMTLVGLGTVTGEVFTNDGTRALSGVDVVLFPSGRFSDPLISRTNVLGGYSLPGVPLGDYRVTANDPVSALSGDATGVMRLDGDTNSTDVLLEPAGQITGTVFLPGVLLDAQGQPVDANGVSLANPLVAAGTGVKIEKGGFAQEVQSGPDGRFASSVFLRLGRYTLNAYPAAGNDGATARATLSQNGQVVDVPMVLEGQGVVEGIVVDAAGVNPVALAQVTLYSQSPFSGGAITRITGADGAFRFDPVPVGEFSVSVRTTTQIPPLGGVAGGTLTANGTVVVFVDGDTDLIHDAVRLQPAGDVTGQVLLADGITFAEGAVAELAGGLIRLARIADVQGVFRFDGLPLGIYALTIREPVTNGIVVRAVQIDMNGQVIDLGSLLLDATPPRVVQTQPGALSSGTSPTLPIVVHFNEEIDPASVNAETFQVLAGGRPVAGTYSVSHPIPGAGLSTGGLPPSLSMASVGSVATFTPTQPFPDLRVISVVLKGDELGFEGQVIRPGIHDLAGLGMIGDVRFSYTTGDTQPPAVVRLSPADGSVEVPLNSVIRFELSEPVNRASLNNFTLTLDGVAVSGTASSAPILGDRVFVFTPTGLLLPNRHYVATLNGPLTDLAGNAMSQARIVTSFATIDTLAPVIQSLTLPAGATLVEGATVAVTADLGTALDVASVEFYVNGTLTQSMNAGPFTTSVFLNLRLAPQATVRAVALDTVGNRSAPVDITLPISPNRPPVVSIVSPAIGSAVRLGQMVTLRVQATDDVGLEQVSFTVDGGAIASGAMPVSGLSNTMADFSFRVPTTLAAGTQIRARAAARDSMLQSVESIDVTLIVEDRTPPVVDIGNPGNDIAVEPGQSVSVFVRADDTGGIASLRLTATGGAVFDTIRTVTPAASPTAETFIVTIPSTALPTESVQLLATAVDTSGNTASRRIQLRINDHLAPQVMLSAVSGGPAQGEPGGHITVRVDAHDEVGVTRIDVSLEGNLAQVRALVPAATSAVEFFDVAIPVDAPLGSALTIQATAFDAAGNQTSVIPLTLTAVDLTAPNVAVVSPAHGSEVLPGTTIEVSIQANDRFGVSTLNFVAEGAVIAADNVLVSPTAPSVDRLFSLLIPTDVGPNRAVVLTAIATDTSGNKATHQIAISIRDVAPPSVNLVIQGGQTEVLRGQSVTVTVSATDDVGVSLLSFVTGGAFVASGDRAVSPPAASASLDFIIPIPDTTADGSVLTLQATASDISNNTQTSAPVLLRIIATPPTLALSPASMRLMVGSTSTLILASQIPAPAGGIVVKLTARPAGVMSVMTPAVIPEGQTQTTVAISGTTLGTATLTADAIGFVGSQSLVMVASPRITGISPANSLQGSVVQATITGELLGGASGILLSGGMTGTIGTGGTETGVAVTIMIPADVPTGAYDFTLTLPSGDLSSGVIRLSIGETFKGPTQIFAAPVSVFVPVSASGGMAGSGIGVSSAVSVYKPAAGSGGTAGQGIGVSPAVSVYKPAVGSGGSAGQGIGVSPAVSVYKPAAGSGGSAGQGVGVSPGVSVFVPVSGSGGPVGPGVSVSPPVSVDKVP